MYNNILVYYLSDSKKSLSKITAWHFKWMKKLERVGKVFLNKYWDAQFSVTSLFTLL